MENMVIKFSFLTKDKKQKNKNVSGILFMFIPELFLFSFATIY